VNEGNSGTHSIYGTEMLQYLPASAVHSPAHYSDPPHFSLASTPLPLSGLLNLNKPPGLTSRDAVDIVQRLARPAKVGHAGTLDPLATGVLVVCVGSATRLIEYVQRMPKCYTGTYLLGRSSPTEDVDGEVSLLPNPPVPTRAEVESASTKFMGPLLQRPPAFSALKVGGQRAYDLARRGEKVELKPRPINVYGLRVAQYEYPKLELEIECSGGTYVRSLGRDLAESLGSAAVMSALVRTAIGPWMLSSAIDPHGLTTANWQARLDPLSKAVSLLPQCELSADEVVRVRKGLFVLLKCTMESAEIAAVDASGRIAAILVPRGSGQWGAAKNFDT
jgi:tRNA pseudouridine55 synthase